MRRPYSQLLLLPFLLPIAGRAQLPASSTTLTTTSPALRLPGSLTLRGAVNSPAIAGGVPTGTVNFFYDGTHSLGSGPLKILPSTQAFVTPVSSTAFGTSPFGLFPLKFASANQSFLGVLDYFPQTLPGATFTTYYPQLTVFSGKGTGLFQTAVSYPITNGNFGSGFIGLMDSYGVGDFNHDGIPDVLIHGYANAYPAQSGEQYYVLFGKADGTFDQTLSRMGPDTSGTTCGCSNPTELLAVDDFNGDGYADVAYAQNGHDPGAGGTIGIAVNPGANPQPGVFGQFITAPAIPGNRGTFLATGIATGHFTSSGHTDLVVVGQFGSQFSPTAQSYLEVFLGQGDGTLVPISSPVRVGKGSSAIATGYFTQNLGVVVDNQATGNIEVLAGDGQGNLLQPTEGNAIGVGTSPSAVIVADFNGDGYSDLLVTDGVNGAQRLILNDGTGDFYAPTVIGSAPNQIIFTAAGDFNGDALTDTATITKFAVTEGSSSAATVYINSAGALASLTTGPHTLPAGAHTVTATFPGDPTFAPSTSSAVPETVTQTPTVLTWTAPAPLIYGTPLSATQLNATASAPGSITYSPPSGTVLAPGSHPLAATLLPTNAFDYAGSTASQTVFVSTPTFLSIAPASAAAGSPNTTLTVNGQGLVSGASVLWNGAALATTFVNPNQLTAVIPASFLAGAGTFTIEVTDPGGVAVLGSQIFSVTQQQQKAASTTALTSSSPTVVRPNGLTLTSMVNQPPLAGGVPAGLVNFTYDGTNPLGSAPLTIIPGSETLPASPSGNPSTPGTNPVGVAAVTLSSSARPSLVAADGTTGVVSLFDTGSSFATPALYDYQLADPAGSQHIDAIGSGYFLQPKSSRIQSFLVHLGSTGFGTLPGTYSVFDGSVTTSAGNSSLAAPLKTSYSGCNCNNPDQEKIAIDDFNGDGYSDVGSLLPSTNAYPYGKNPAVVGVTLNAGSSNPGIFPSTGSEPIVTAFLPAPLPANFCAIAITTGNFTTAAGAQLAVLGATPASNDCSNIVPGDPSSVHLFGLNSSNAFVEVGSTATDSGATTLAVGDLNQDGKIDLIVGEAAGVKVLFGNGDGTFQAASTLTSAIGAPLALSVSDLNGDGFPDLASTLSTNGGLAILLNDGAGNLKTATQPYALATAPAGIANADLNLDGLPDLAVVVAGNQAGTINGSINILLNSASAQAVLALGPAALPLGTHAVTATFPGDLNFLTSTSTAIQEVVTATVSLLTWAAPAPIEYGVPLSAAQLNATANVPGTITYSQPVGAVLPPGINTVFATFTPTDTLDYTSATATQTVTVAAPTLTGIAPATGKLGDPDTTIVVNGQGLLSGAVVQWNGTALATTFVNLNQLTAVVPASFFANAGTFNITVAEPNEVTVAGSQVFTITAPGPTASASASATLTTGQQGFLTLTVSPYPAPITATLTIAFTPAPPITVNDPTVLFANNSTTETILIPANSTTAIPPIGIQAGSTAGTITITIQLNAGGVNITPGTLVPVVITVPAGPPAINSATLTRSGKTIQVSVIGLSSTREMVDAEFVFTPVAGKTITVNNSFVALTSAFGAWYGSAASDAFGTTFTYTQPFTLDFPATDIASVTVTLNNSRGSSPTVTVQ